MILKQKKKSVMIKKDLEKLIIDFKLLSAKVDSGSSRELAERPFQLEVAKLAKERRSNLIICKERNIIRK